MTLKMFSVFFLVSSKGYSWIYLYIDHLMTLVAGALHPIQWMRMTGFYSVPTIQPGTSTKYNAYSGWESTSGSASGYHSLL